MPGLTDPKKSIWILLIAQLVVSQSTARDGKEGSRIVNGEQAKQGDFPFLASLIFETEPVFGTCGATLFTASRLFTACHCLMNDSHPYYKYPNFVFKEPDKIQVVAGSIHNDVEYYQEGVGTYVKTLVVHPGCEHNKTAILYDYGVVEVQSAFILRKGFIEVYTISAQEKDRITQAIMKPDNLLCQTMGWGAIEDNTAGVGFLNKINMTLMSLELCQKTIFRKTRTMGDGWFVREIQTCAVGQGENQTACGGDSGGPLVCGVKNKIIIGVNSQIVANKCGENDTPLVVARLDYAWDWIINALPPERNPQSSSTTADPITTTKTLLLLLFLEHVS